MTDDDLEALAGLARLKIEPSELGELGTQLDQILGYLRGLAAVDVANVEPFFGPRDGPTPLRADEPAPALPRAEALAGVPQHDDEYVIVPRFLAET